MKTFEIPEMNIEIFTMEEVMTSVSGDDIWGGSGED